MWSEDSGAESRERLSVIGQEFPGSFQLQILHFEMKNVDIFGLNCVKFVEVSDMKMRFISSLLLFHTLYLLDIYDVVELNALVFMHKVFTGALPENILKFF